MSTSTTTPIDSEMSTRDSGGFLSASENAFSAGAEPALHGGEGAEVYRSVSRAAVLSCVFGVLGLVAFTTPWLLPISITGAVAAFVAFAAFRRYPEELVGMPAAIGGLILCALTLVAAPAWHIYVYATEVPEGYTRISFDSLMTATGQPELPTEKALELDGQQIFIKGYIHPNSMDSLMSKRFVIVPDLGTCCFGGQPPLTHMIEVTLTGEQFAQKSYRKQRLAGTLHVNRNLKPVDELTGVFYTLRADVLK